MGGYGDLKDQHSLHKRWDPGFEKDQHSLHKRWDPGFEKDQHSLHKRWDPRFEKDSNFRDNESVVENRRKLNLKSDDVNIFMRYQDIRSSRAVDRVISDCKGATIDNVKSGNGSAGTRRAAWLDDRSVNRNTPARDHENPLTATGLYNALHEKRYDHDSLNTVNRRLVFIRNPGPDYYLALGHTATEYQLPALTDSFCRQGASKPFIDIKAPPRGKSRFVMSLDLPFYELRNRPPSSQDASRPGLHERGRQPSIIDLSVLSADSPGFQDQQKSYLYSAHFSFRLIGADHRNWTAYAFARGETNDLVPDPEEPDEDGELVGNDEYDEEYDDPVTSPIEDPIAFATELDMPAVRADEPIFDPRVYFLVIFEHWAVRIVKEWTDVVDLLQHDIKNYEAQSSTSLAPEGNGGVRDTRQAFRWTQKTLRLLRPLLDVLSKTMTAWELFVNRDIARFSDLMSPERDDLGKLARNSFDAIRQSSDELKRLREDLNALMESCRASAKELKLQLILESNQAAHHNGAIADFANWIMNPATLVATCFSMQQGTLPFKPDFKIFIVATAIVMISFRVLFWVLRLRRPKDNLLAQLSHFSTDVTTLRPTRDWFRSLRRRRSGPSQEIDDMGLEDLGAV